MQRWIVPVTMVCVTIGALVAVQYKSQSNARQLMPSRRVEDLASMLRMTEKANEQLAGHVAEMQGQLRKAQLAEAPSRGTPRPLYPPLGGPGLTVTITESGAEEARDDGTSAAVTAEDLLKIVNELRSGGAEAVSLNGHRLTEVSEIVTAGQHVMVNRAPVRPPYTIIAIGPATEMKNALALRGGVTEYLSFYGIQVKSTASKQLTVPPAKEERARRFAKQVQPE